MISQNLSANVFDQTFVVFDPYPDQKKVIHRFLGLLPFVGFFTALGLIMVVWSIVTTGFLLSVFIIIIGTSVVIIEEAPEIYMNYKTYLKAIRNHSSFAIGDLKVLQLIKKLMPKLSNYYLGLSTLFILASLALPYLGGTVPLLFQQFMDSMQRSSGVNGTVVLEIMGVLFVLNLWIIQFFAYKIKNRIFRFEVK